MVDSLESVFPLGELRAVDALADAQTDAPVV